MISEFPSQEPTTGQWKAELLKIQSDIARDRPAEAPAVPDERPRRRSGRGTKLVMALVAGAIILAVLFGPGIVGSILDRWDYSRSVHEDRSVAEHGVAPRMKRKALVVVRDEHGNPVRVLADADAVSDFVRREIARVEIARRDTHTRVRAALEARAAPVFAKMQSRVPAFADWYYAWPTSYRLTGKAMYSAAANALKPSVMRLDDAVAHDVARYVEKRYRDIVMRPELSDPLLQWAYLHALETGESGFQQALNGFDDRFRRFVAEETDYLDGESDLDGVSLVLDWDHQAKKLTLSGMDQGTVEVIRGATLTAGGALAGQRVGAAVGARLAQGISNRAAATAAARGVAARLAGPYVARGMGTVAATAVGASGGPMGALVGGAAGLGLDYAINEGVEHVERDSFETGIKESLSLQQRQWQQTMQGSLDEAVNVWFDDMAELLAVYDAG